MSEKENTTNEENASQQNTQQAPPYVLPKPSLEVLVSSFASQAMIFLGAIPNPLSGKQERDIDRAKFTIDLIEVIKEKTAGNLSEAEQKMIDSNLFDLRMRYVNSAGKTI